MPHLLDLSTLTGGSTNYSYSSVHSRSVTVYCFLVGSSSHGEFTLMHGQICNQPKIQGDFSADFQSSLSVKSHPILCPILP